MVSIDKSRFVGMWRIYDERGLSMGDFAAMDPAGALDAMARANRPAYRDFAAYWSVHGLGLVWRGSVVYVGRSGEFRKAGA